MLFAAPDDQVLLAPDEVEEAVPRRGSPGRRCATSRRRSRCSRSRLRPCSTRAWRPGIRLSSSPTSRRSHSESSLAHDLELHRTDRLAHGPDALSSPSSFGITMYAGPASVIPYELETVASGQAFACSREQGARRKGGTPDRDGLEAAEVRFFRTPTWRPAARPSRARGNAIVGRSRAHDLEPPVRVETSAGTSPCRPIFIGL